MRRVWMTAAWTIVAGSLGARALRSQEALLPTSSWGTAPIFAAWHFATPITQTTGALNDVRQFALPLHAQFQVTDRWSVDVSGAASSSSASFATGGATRTLTLSGLSDVRVRISGPLVGDAVRLTAGLNLPTGTTSLGADGTAVLQTIAAPALGMPAGALGLGFGGTLGVVAAREAGPWAMAVGASAEARREYTPIDLALQSGNTVTTLTPGTVVHVTVGGTRDVGDDRLSLLLVADAYQKDQLATAQGSGSPLITAYTLGPQVSALGRLEWAVPGWRQASGGLAVRYRSPFADATGATVSGSGGTYVEAAFTGIRGAATGPGFIVGADARYHSGLSFTDALVGAAVSAVGVTLGVELPASSTVVRLATRAQYGHFDTGTTQSNGMGISLVAAFAARGRGR